MKLQHINPVGHADVPLLGRQGHPEDKVKAGAGDKLVPMVGDERWGFGCLEPGEVFECTAEQGRHLLEQHMNYAPADEAATKHRARIDKRIAAEQAGTEPATDEGE